jgi:5'-methylthioadenosine phosphorylase
MPVAVIGGSGIYDLPGASFTEKIVETPYGKAKIYRGKDEYSDVIFLNRHGIDHSVPPHRINYRANIKALELSGVKRVMATFAVGSLRRDIPPPGLVALDQFIDNTQGRISTFYEEKGTGFAHTEMTEPYCRSLSQRLVQLAKEKGIPIRPRGTYVCTNGPRFETAAEVRMYAQIGGDVVGMTGVPEAPLARELGLHYAAVAFSINYAAGLQSGQIEIHDTGKDLESVKARLISLFIEALRTPELPPCNCESCKLFYHPPQENA